MKKQAALIRSFLILNLFLQTTQSFAVNKVIVRLCTDGLWKKEDSSFHLKMIIGKDTSESLKSIKDNYTYNWAISNDTISDTSYCLIIVENKEYSIADVVRLPKSCIKYDYVVNLCFTKEKGAHKRNAYTLCVTYCTGISECRVYVRKRTKKKKYYFVPLYR